MKRFSSLTLVAVFAAFNASAVFAHDDDAPIVHGSLRVTSVRRRYG